MFNNIYIDIENWALNAWSEPASLMCVMSRPRVAGPRHVLPGGASEATVSGNHQEGHRRGQRHQAAVGRRQVRGPGKLTASHTPGSEVSVAMTSPPRATLLCARSERAALLTIKAAHGARQNLTQNRAGQLAVEMERIQRAKTTGNQIPFQKKKRSGVFF